MIDLNVNEAQRKKNIQRCKEKGILLPTYAQMREGDRESARLHLESVKRILAKDEPDFMH